MKKFILIVSMIVACWILGDHLVFRLGWFIDLSPNQPVETFVKTDETQIYLNDGNGYELFTIKGVNMGSGEPGQWSTEFDIDKEIYLNWFNQIQEMGANTLRIYTVQNEEFYEAFYEYNRSASTPLYLIHGVWVNDYAQNSYRDAYDEDIYWTFLEDAKSVVDVIHGNKKISEGSMLSAGHGAFHYDISQWVIGYILGVEWEDLTVAYTDEKYKEDEDKTSYQGKYMYTTEEASAFETMLARVGDQVIEYESTKYKQQRLVAFSNWPTTDPFIYPESVTKFYMKCASVNVEHIKTTQKFLSGQFASYHVYPYYPDYLNYTDKWTYLGIKDINTFITEEGNLNTYKAYLSMLTNYHTMPVVISEFGVSTGRGMAHEDENTGRNQGKMSETEQGEALISCYEDIMDSGCAGAVVFSWQDEWFKRTWNTMHAVNLKRTPYWSDYQTNEQYFGLLSFDPGEEASIVYVDGDIQDWNEADMIVQNEDMTLSMKYDEKFIYLLVKKENFDLKEDILYIPIDTTPKSGSNYCENYDLLFDRFADFILVINGYNHTRLQVQQRYEALRSTYSQNVYQVDSYVKNQIPDIDTPRFVNIDMILKTQQLDQQYQMTVESEVFETGLLTYGNANPKSESFNSLADFIVSGDYIEIKLPWQLLNFSDPSRMSIHDDYYDDNYGVEYINIESMYLGISDGTDQERVELKEAKLEGWENKVTYHERLKKSYYILQEYWRDDE